MVLLKHSALVLGTFLLTGCGITDKAGSVRKDTAGKVAPVALAVAKQAVAPAVDTKAVPPAPEAVPATGVEGCDRELKALKKLDAQRYARRRAQFTRLMSGASVYAGIRTDVAGGTREAVDAMYRYRTGKLCAEISQDVLDALARQGDSVADGHN